MAEGAEGAASAGAWELGCWRDNQAGRRRRSEGNGEDVVVQVAGNEGVGMAVDEAADGGDEWPTQDGGDRDGIAKGNAHGGRAAIGVGIG
eukprot:scaffold12354_cov176-Amphora_coffeaeformis.AAC.1